MKATHIIGGEISFRCLGNDRYEITMYIYRDCGPGNAGFDTPGLISFFDSSNNLVSDIATKGVLQIPLLNVERLPELTFQDSCIRPPEFCVETGFYQTVVVLPYLEGGYQLVYIRCCRNRTITNIVDPGGTEGVYVTYLSDQALTDCSQGVRFQEYPPPAVCVNTPINYDHSIIGGENDSVVYRLCNPLMRDPVNPNNNPPFASVIWIEPTYQVNNMLGGPDSLKIDPLTGLLTGTPSITGQFVVGICTDVYRDGKLFTTMNRDFQYNVGRCDYTFADFEHYDNYCLQPEINFENSSLDNVGSEWYWGGIENPIDFSSDRHPVFSPGQPGDYEMTLIALGNYPECNDTISKIINVVDEEYRANISVEFGECSDSLEIILIPELISDIPGSNDFLWTVSYNNTANNYTDSTIAIFVQDTDSVTINLLVSGKESHCWAETRLSVETNWIFEDRDTIHHFICKGSSLRLNPDFIENLDFWWTPDSSLLDSQNVANPLAMPPESTIYNATMSTSNCEANMAVKVEVFDQSIHSKPDTLCGTGEFSFASPWGDESSQVVWWFSRNGTVLGSRAGVEVNFNFNAPGNWLVQVMARDPVHNNCKDTLFIPLFLVEQSLSLDGHITGSGNCLDTVEAFVTANLQGQDFSPDQYLWLVSGDTIVTRDPELNFPFPGTGELEVTLLVPNNLGCDLREEIVLVPDLNNEVIIRDSVYHCYGDTLLIQTGLSSDFSFSWTPDTYFLTEVHVPNPLAKPGKDIDYTAIIEKGDCKVFYELNVQVFNHSLDLPDYLFCDSLQAVVQVGEKEGIEYNWEVENLSDSLLSDDGSKVLFIAKDPGVYPIVLILSDSLSGCSFKMQSELTLVDTELFDFEIDPLTQDCSGPIVLELNALTPSDSSGHFGFFWQISGDTTFSFDGETFVSQLPESQILVELTGTDQYGCSRTISKELKLEAISGNFEPDTLIICPGDTVHLNPEFNAEYNYIWSPAAGMIDLLTSPNPAVSPDDSQLYVGEVSNQLCKKTKSVWVETLPAPVISGIYASPNPVLRFVEDSYLNLDFRPPDATIEWRPPQYLDNANVPNPVASVDYTTTFTVTLTTSDGCSTSKSIEVVVNDLPCEDPYVFLPNAFSPNGDGENDLLFLRGDQVESMELMVYDRWGQRVFYSNSQERGWDGTFNGQPMPAGSYSFFLEASCYDGGRSVKRGSVLLVR